MLSDDDQQFLQAARGFWHPVARAADVAPGQALPVTLLGEELVLWRTADGALSLFDDLCAHRGVRLSLGEVTDGGCLRCPYHAWEYGSDGRCTRIPQLADGRIPARAAVARHQVDEHSGLIWACLAAVGEERRPAPRFVEVEPGGTHWLHTGEPMTWACQASRQIENF